MITADPSSELYFWCRKVARMKPGERLTVDMRDLERIPSFEHKGATFTPPDRILGNIVGAGYTHSYDIDPFSRRVTFARHENTGQQRHEDPDRRQKSRPTPKDEPAE